MDFKTFVAGETRVILNMSDYQEARCRLKFLSKLMHWLYQCRDWSVLRGMYEAVLESIELGEETWCSDFSHYENLLPNQIRVDREFSGKKANKEKLKIYWCKSYQRNACTEQSPHMTTLRADEPPVPVVHCCARGALLCPMFTTG